MNEELKRRLELAAKAIGGELSHGHTKVRTGETWDKFEWRGSPGIQTPSGWKPHGGVTIHPQENNGDSRRLQIALRMSLELCENEDGEYWKASAGEATALEWVMNHNGDHEAAARTSVLRCAVRVAQLNALEALP